MPHHVMSEEYSSKIQQKNATYSLFITVKKHEDGNLKMLLTEIIWL